MKGITVLVLDRKGDRHRGSGLNLEDQVRSDRGVIIRLHEDGDRSFLTP